MVKQLHTWLTPSIDLNGVMTCGANEDNNVHLGVEARSQADAVKATWTPTGALLAGEVSSGTLNGGIWMNEMGGIFKSLGSLTVRW